MTTNLTATTAIGRRSVTGRTSLFNDLRLAYARWQERARIRFELRQMNPRELADLGLNPSDINDVANGTYLRG